MRKVRLREVIQLVSGKTRIQTKKLFSCTVRVHYSVMALTNFNHQGLCSNLKCQFMGTNSPKVSQKNLI